MKKLLIPTKQTKFPFFILNQNKEINGQLWCLTFLCNINKVYRRWKNSQVKTSGEIFNSPNLNLNSNESNLMLVNNPIIPVND